MVRQHHEQYGQRNVVVVRRTHLGFLRPLGIGGLAGEELGHGFALVGHDDQKDVGGHHGRHQRSGVNERPSAGKHLSEDEAHHHDEAETDEREQRVVVGEGRFAQQIVNQPAEGERENADQRRLPRLQSHDRGVDEKKARLSVVDPAQKAEARHPGPIRLPFVPDKVIGQRGGRDGVLAHLIESAAVHLPGNA